MKQKPCICYTAWFYDTFAPWFRTALPPKINETTPPLYKALVVKQHRCCGSINLERLQQTSQVVLVVLVVLVLLFKQCLNDEIAIFYFLLFTLMKCSQCTVDKMWGCVIWKMPTVLYCPFSKSPTHKSANEKLNYLCTRRIHYNCTPDYSNNNN